MSYPAEAPPPAPSPSPVGRPHSPLPFTPDSPQPNGPAARTQPRDDMVRRRRKLGPGGRRGPPGLRSDNGLGRAGPRPAGPGRPAAPRSAVACRQLARLPTVSLDRYSVGLQPAFVSRPAAVWTSSSHRQARGGTPVRQYTSRSGRAGPDRAGQG